MLCRRFAEAFPDNVVSLITIGSNQQFVADQQYPAAMAESDFTAFINSWQADPANCLRRFAGLQAQGDPQQRQIMRQLRNLKCSIDSESGGALLSLLGRLRWGGGKISVPALYLFGQHDALVPVAAADLLPQAKVIEHAGHLPYLSSTQLVIKAIGDFLEGQRYQLDKPGIADSFGRAAKHYDSAANLQHRIGEQLLQSINGEPDQIMDLGCGTGFHSIQLQQRYPKAQVLGVDISAGMLTYAKNRYIDQPIEWLCGDAENLNFASASQSLIFSNFALQWCDCLDTLAAELYRVLQPGGQLVLAVPGPHTLAELRQAWAEVDSAVHVNRFASLSQWQQALASAGFTQMDLHSHTVTEKHDSVRALLLELKNVGAHNNNAGRPATMTGKQQLKALYNAYEPCRLASGELPATWEIISGTVVKAK
jgi:malonyl-CoA O-methyltransferase